MGTLVGGDAGRFVRLFTFLLNCRWGRWQVCKVIHVSVGGGTLCCEFNYVVSDHEGTLVVLFVCNVVYTAPPLELHGQLLCK